VTLRAIGSCLLVLAGPSLIQALNKLQALAEADVQENTPEAHTILEHVISTKALLTSNL
jgi:hypothetical protein